MANYNNFDHGFCHGHGNDGKSAAGKSVGAVPSPTVAMDGGTAAGNAMVQGSVPVDGSSGVFVHGSSSGSSVGSTSGFFPSGSSIAESFDSSRVCIGEGGGKKRRVDADMSTVSCCRATCTGSSSVYKDEHVISLETKLHGCTIEKRGMMLRFEQERAKWFLEKGQMKKETEQVKERLQRAEVANCALRTELSREKSTRHALKDGFDLVAKQLERSGQRIRLLLDAVRKSRAEQRAQEMALRVSILESQGVGFIDEWPTATEDVQVLEAIAEGCFGEVRPIVAKDGRKQAHVSALTGGRGLVKKVTREGVHPSAAESIRREILLYSRYFPPTVHPNVVNVFAMDPRGGSIIMEKMDGGDLHGLFGSTRWRDLDIHHKTRLMSQAVRGIMQMHSMGVVHGDIKLANFLVTQDLTTAKVTDLGLSGGYCRFVTEEMNNGRHDPKVDVLAQVIGSQACGGCMESIAPESMGLFAREAERYTMSVESDVYSLGHLVLQGLRAQSEELLSPEVLMKSVQQRVDPSLFAPIRDRSSVDYFMRVYLMMHAKLDTGLLLSDAVWPEQGQLMYRNEVLLVMSSVVNPDPRHRLSGKGLWKALQFPDLWATSSVNSDERRNRSRPPLPDEALSFLTGVTKLSRAQKGEAPPWYKTHGRRRWWTCPVHANATAPF